MSSNTRVIAAPPQRVWDVLADGWLYPLWVVGASRMREVDDTWPLPGSRLHHSAGAWPALVDDITVVTGCSLGERLVLEARGWPLGQAEVTITLTPAPAPSTSPTASSRGDGGTAVRLEEDASGGPARLVPRPLRTPVLRWRNAETLRRLAYLVERRADH